MFAWGVKVWLAGATGCSLSGAAECAEILTGLLAVRCGNTIIGAQSPQSWKTALLSLTCLLLLPVKGISREFSREIAGIMYSAWLLRRHRRRPWTHHTWCPQTPQCVKSKRKADGEAKVEDGRNVTLPNMRCPFWTDLAKSKNLS